MGQTQSLLSCIEDAFQEDANLDPLVILILSFSFEFPDGVFRTWETRGILSGMYSKKVAICFSQTSNDFTVAFYNRFIEFEIRGKWEMIALKSKRGVTEVTLKLSPRNTDFFSSRYGVSDSRQRMIKSEWVYAIETRTLTSNKIGWKFHEKNYHPWN